MTKNARKNASTKTKTPANSEVNPEIDEEKMNVSASDDDFDDDNDDEVESGETASDSDAPKRGGPRGPKGPRRVYFVLSAIVDGELVQEEIQATVPRDPNEFNASAAASEVTAIFQGKYDVSKSEIKISRAFTPRRSLDKPRVKRDGITRSAKTEDLEIQGGKFMAVMRYKNIDWQLKIQRTNDPGIAFVSKFMGPVNSKDAELAKKSKPTTSYVPMESLRDIQEINKEDASAHS